MKIPLTPLLLAALLPACVLPPGEPEPLQAELVLRLDSGELAPPGAVYLKPIPGGLAGRAKDAELLRQPFASGELRIALEGVQQALERHAAPIENDARNPGELVRPRSARFARLGTFFDGASGRGCEEYSLSLHGKGRAGYLLVYVDRPSSISGTRYIAPYIFDYRLRFPDSGLYAIGLRRSGQVVEPFIAGNVGQLGVKIRTAGCERDGRLAAN